MRPIHAVVLPLRFTSLVTRALRSLRADWPILCTPCLSISINKVTSIYLSGLSGLSKPLGTPRIAEGTVVTQIQSHVPAAHVGWNIPWTLDSATWLSFDRRRPRPNEVENSGPISA